MSQQESSLCECHSVHPCGHPTTSATTSSDGHGAGSLYVYEEMRKTNWHGRLGRAHMVDVDRMFPSARTELDIYLNRTIKALFPINGGYTIVNPDTTFATLSAFGLRLEDRGPLGDGAIPNDDTIEDESTILRMKNHAAFDYTYGTRKFEQYWRASALETLVELARYRGLFSEEGFLNGV